MAAIDKLYLKDYQDLVELRKWAYVYYPKLLLYFYSEVMFMDCTKFNKIKKQKAKRQRDAIKKQWTFYSLDGTVEGAIACLKDKYGLSEEAASEQVTQMYDDYKKTLSQLEKDADIIIMNTPSKVDKKLVWICPVYCIRKYLENQCGIKTKWYHKLFWKGKKHFVWK